jgi:hypothetical protein
MAIELVSFVYFIEAPEVRRIKIGYSEANPDGRFVSLDTASPVRLEKRALMLGSRDTERHLHRKFAAYAVKREWFEFVPEIREYIAKWASNWDNLLFRVERCKFEEIVRRNGRIERRSLEVDQ